MPAVAEVPPIARTALGDLRGAVEGGVAVWRGTRPRATFGTGFGLPLT